MIILNINVMVLEIKIYHLKNILIKLIHTWIYINMILVPSKNWVFFGGGTKYFARKGNKLEKEWRWGGWCRNGRVATFLLLYSSITFTLSVCLCVCVCLSVSLSVSLCSLSVLSLFSLCLSVCVCVCVYMRACVRVCGGEVRFPLLLFGSSVFWVTNSRFSSMSLL